MHLRKRGKPVRFRDPPVLSVIVREIRVPVEEEQMGVEQLAMAAEHAHKYLHRSEVEQQTSVRESTVHRLQSVLHAGQRCALARKETIVEPVFLMIWRRERDSNPRNRFRFSGFQDHRHRPLGHPSARAILFGNPDTDSAMDPWPAHAGHTGLRFDGMRSVSGDLPSDQTRSFNWTDPI